MIIKDPQKAPTHIQIRPLNLHICICSGNVVNIQLSVAEVGHSQTIKIWQLKENIASNLCLLPICPHFEKDSNGKRKNKCKYYVVFSGMREEKEKRERKCIWQFILSVNFQISAFCQWKKFLSNHPIPLKWPKPHLPFSSCGLDHLLPVNLPQQHNF